MESSRYFFIIVINNIITFHLKLFISRFIWNSIRNSLQIGIVQLVGTDIGKKGWWYLGMLYLQLYDEPESIIIVYLWKGLLNVIHEIALKIIECVFLPNLIGDFDLEGYRCIEFCWKKYVYYLSSCCLVFLSTSLIFPLWDGLYEEKALNRQRYQTSEIQS